MKGSKMKWMKKAAALLCAATVITGWNMGDYMQVSAAQSSLTEEEKASANEQNEAAVALAAGEYIVPIKALVSAAPIPAVKQAFAEAFGETVELTVEEDHSYRVKAKCNNMTIDLMGNQYKANIMSVTGGDILSTKKALSSKGFGDSSCEEIDAPEWVAFPVSGKNADSVEITVDFMNKFLGQGNPYPTNVTLALDYANAERVFKDGTYSVEVKLWNANNDKPSMAAAAIKEEAKMIVVNQKRYLVLYTQPMQMGKIKSELMSLQVAKNDGNYAEATVVEKSATGKAATVLAELPSNEAYIAVKVQPELDFGAMHNPLLDARIKINYASMKYMSEETTLPALKEDVTKNQKEEKGEEKNDKTAQSTRSDVTNTTSLKDTNGVLKAGTTMKAYVLTGGAQYELATALVKKSGKDSKCAVMEIDLQNEEGEVHQLSGKVAVTVDAPWTLEMGKTFAVYRVDEENATLVACDTSYSNGKISFETNHFSTFVLVEEMAAKAPKTGDQAPIALLVLLGIIGSATVGVSVRKNKKIRTFSSMNR